MINTICNNLNEYFIQFSGGETEKPIRIRCMKWDDELLDDAIQFYSQEDHIAFNNLHRLLDHCKTEMLEMAKKQNFELISDLKEQSTIYKGNIETILRRSSFASGKTFTLTKDAVIVYVNKAVIDGHLFKKFFVINERENNSYD